MKKIIIPNFVLLVVFIVVSFGSNVSLIAQQKSCHTTIKWLESMGRLAVYKNEHGLTLRLSKRKDPEGYGITSKEFTRLYSCENINALIIGFIQFENNNHIKAILVFKNLEKLTIHDSSFTDRQLMSLISLTKLKKLSLERTKITDHGVAFIGKFIKLVSLDLNQKNILGKGFKNLVNCRQLKQVSLTCSKNVNQYLSYIAQLPLLKEINLFGDIDNEGLNKFRHAPNLVSLGYKGFKITNNTLKILAGFKNWPKLSIFHYSRISYSLKYDHSMNLRPTKVTGHGLKYLSDLKITELILPKSMTNNDLIYLKTIANIQMLETLYLSDNITDNGISHLLFLKNLKELHVNHKITKKALYKIKKAIPGLTFSYTFFLD